MSPPKVTEVPRLLEPVEHDTFIDDLRRQAAPLGAEHERPSEPSDRRLRG